MLPEIPKYQERWIAFFDILGFRSLIEKSIDELRLYMLVESYYEVLNELKEKCNYYEGHELIYQWFSDSFIFYSRDGSAQSYVIIQQAAKHFLESNIYNRIPLRGAVAFGNLYVEEDKSIVIGPSLVEAYLYCENQEWVNVILTLSAAAKVKQFNLILEHHSFTSEDIKLNSFSSENVYAYTFCSGEANFESPLLSCLREMQHFAPEKAKQKYQNTIERITKYWKWIH